MHAAEIRRIAMEQSAVDSGCSADDFLAGENKVVLSRAHPDARKYLELPFICDLTSYGSNIVASVRADLQEMVSRYIHRFSPEHCFETPGLHVLMDELRPLGLNVCFMAEYFLPVPEDLRALDCAYEVRVLQPADFADCYLPQWSNALCKERRSLDVLAVGAYDRGQLIGLAGCSADCAAMWQIGVDVLPAYRRQGVASCLTSRLALETLDRHIVPFYCCAWANIRSARNALRSGFRPAWAQLTVKSQTCIAGMNT